MSHKRRVNIETVLSAIKKHHGDSISLDVTTYTGTSHKARFVDVDYGEWWTLPSNVMAGCRHRKRANKGGAQSVSAHHQRCRDEEALLLVPLEPLVRELYGDKRMSIAQVRDECMRIVQREITKRAVGAFIRDLGIKRTVKQNRFYSPMDCELCGERFTARSGRQRWCSTCVPQATWTARTLGMTQAQYDDAVHLQGNSCAICRRSFADIPTRQIHTDHCHVTNKFRGILCVHCNHGLGCFFDDPNRLRIAALYLEKHGAIARVGVVP